MSTKTEQVIGEAAVEKQQLTEFNHTALDRFTTAMREHLGHEANDYNKQADWRQDGPNSLQDLAHQLVESIGRGDPIEIAAYCMKFYMRGGTEAMLRAIIEEKSQPVSCELQVTNGWVRIQPETVKAYQRQHRVVRMLYTNPVPYQVASRDAIPVRAGDVVTIKNNTCRLARKAGKCDVWCGDIACSSEMQRMEGTCESAHEPASLEMRELTASFGRLNEGKPVLPNHRQGWDRRQVDRRRR